MSAFLCVWARPKRFSLNNWDFPWQTCENFAQLAKRGYYNGVIFHRIIAVCPRPIQYDSAYASASRISWCKAAIQLGRAKVALAYTVKSCTSHTTCLPMYGLRIETPFLTRPPSAKTRSIQTYDLRAPGFSRWPTRGPTPTVRHLAPPSNPSSPPLPLSVLISLLRCRETTSPRFTPDFSLA
jgi:hypothetical protein